MDITELRRLIRAAILAAPLAGCGGGSPPPEPPPEPEPEAEASEPRETEEEEATATTAGSEDRVLTDEEWERRWRSSGGGDDTGVVIMEGRPLLGVAGPALAPVATPRDLVARYWADAGVREHASIASFARATLELMQLGAPLSLVEAHQRAGADEAVHARLCFALAERFGGPTMRPGALSVPAPRSPTLAQLAVDVYREGALNETVAAWLASYARERCQEPAVVAALARIADDEAAHAALAWQTLRWALAADDASVRPALEAERERRVVLATDAPPEGRASHGVLGRDEAEQQARRAFERLVRPTLAELLG